MEGPVPEEVPQELPPVDCSSPYPPDVAQILHDLGVPDAITLLRVALKQPARRREIYDRIVAEGTTEVSKLALGEPGVISAWVHAVEKKRELAGR